ncbi:MAG: EAL domain-containing protein [Pseudomonadales bacterium]|nr:EAL domain-containing protein [Pseudomonadales bacterium]
MLNRYTIKLKLPLLVILPILVCLMLFYSFSQHLYTQLQVSQSIQQRFTFFSELEDLFIQARALKQQFSSNKQNSYSLKNYQKAVKQIHTFDIRILQQNLTKFPQQAFYDLLQDAEEISKLADIDDLEDIEKIDLISSMIANGLHLIANLPLDVSATELRNSVYAYILLMQLLESSSLELSLYQLAYKHQIDINRYELQQIVGRQQFLLEQYIHQFSTPKQVEFLLSTFDSPSFTLANNIRNQIIIYETPAQEIITAEKLLIIADRTDAIQTVISYIQEFILLQTAQSIKQQKIQFSLSIAAIIIMLCLIISMAINICYRILKSLSFIGETLKGIEDSRDYQMSILIPGRDEFSQLSQLLQQLIQQRQNAEEALLKNHQSNAMLLDSAAEAIIGLDANFCIESMNPAAEKLFLCSFADKQGQGLSDLVAEAHIPFEIIDPESDDAATLRIDQVDWVLHNGETISLSFSLALNLNGDGSVFICRDISKYLKIEKQLHHATHFDSESGLANKKSLKSTMPKLIEEGRETGKKLAVILFSLRRFKSINDTMGREGGDQVILELSHRLQKMTHGGELLARWGGIKFALCLLSDGDEGAIAERAEAMIAVMQTTIHIADNTVAVNAVAGVALMNEEQQSADQLIQLAETALTDVRAKNNCPVVFYSKDIAQQIERQNQIAQSIIPSMKKQRMFMVFQPKVNLKTQRLTGFEALLRWKNEQGVFISPEEFIPIAENTEAIVDIGDFVISEVFKQMRQWLDLGLLDKHHSIAINVSPMQFSANDFEEKLEKKRLQYQLAENAIELEITETSIVTNIEATADKLVRLRKQGYKIAIDDFGTGYSSLGYLSKLSFDNLKIDKIFITPCAEEGTDNKVLHHIIHLSHAIGVETTAEGIEDKAQRDLLAEWGATTAQGYYYSKPLSVKDASELLAKPSLLLSKLEPS